MLNNIIKIALNNRLMVVIASIFLLFGGSYIASEMEVDVFPDLTAPTVVILTEAQGLAPEEVEKLVSFHIETAVNGATNVRRVRSSSSSGFSIVWVEFNWGTDIYKARQTVNEKLSIVLEKMPKGVSNPIMAPQSSIMGEMMMMSLSSDSVSPMELRTISDWIIRPRLLALGGVAQVITIGGEYKQYQILADPLKMQYFDVSMNELKTACQESNSNASGGFMNQHGNEYIIRAIGRTENVEEISQTLIKTKNGNSITIGDVARIKIGGANPKIGNAAKNTLPAVMLTVAKQPNTNTLVLTEKIDEALIEITKNLPKYVELNAHIFRQADFIEASLSNIKKALLEGSIFVVIIMFFFLMNFRTTVISLIAIPISLIVAILTLEILGISLNTMSLGGMAIAIGSLVDDAVIDVENVYKRLRENAVLSKGNQKPTLTIVFDASKEIRSSILNATLIIIIAFIPLFFLSGMEGKMLQPLGISFIVSLFASLIVAVTLTPVLCSLLLTNEEMLIKECKGSWVENTLTKWYGIALEKVLKAKKLVLLLAIGLFVLSAIGFTNFGRSFLPEFNEGSLVIEVTTMPGTSLEESEKIGIRVEKLLLEISEISLTARRTGRAELAEHTQGVNTSEVDVPFLLETRSREEFMLEVREKLSAVTGASITIGQPIGHRIDHMLSGTRANIALKLFGTDLNEMYQTAKKIEAEIEGVEGLVDLSVEQQIEIPQIQIKANREMLKKYGITIGHFTEFVAVAFAGETVGQVYEKDRNVDLVLRYKEEYRTSIDAIKNVLIDTEDGQKIPLSYVSNIVSTSGPNTVNRENVQRKLVISANAAGRDLRSVVNDIKLTIEDKVVLPENYRLEYGGQFESEEKASKTLMLTSILSIIIIFLLLYQEFKNLKLASIILLNLPLALIGGVFSIWLTGNVISIPSIIGFITLFGIATRNGILLVSRYEQLKLEGEQLYERIVKGSVDRLNPIVMTALTTALALIPLALAGNLPGNEIQSPMAIVILGGLLTATILNVFVIPIVYYQMNKKEENEK
jgi:CzcA family heavy metal efflux pump